MIKAVVVGAAGRMAGTVIKVMARQKDFSLVGAVEAPSHPLLGKDAGECLGAGKIGVNLTQDLESVLRNADVGIEFTTPGATIEHLRIASQLRKPIVLGTTGFSEDEKKEIEKLAKAFPCLLSPNMSLGVNVLFKLIEEAARALGDGYDAEIIEAHHHGKADAPSGTAKKIAEIIARAKKIDLAKKGVYGRKGKPGPRAKDEIGIMAVRAGDIVGEHTVILAGQEERLELTHRAHTRETFALGALAAARFIVKAKPGLYDMSAVL